jgi:hypothetical protein
LIEKLNGGTPSKRIDCAAAVVTAPDLSKPEIQTLLRPPLEKYLQ